jgi:micrococcal nuclease
MGIRTAEWVLRSVPSPIYGRGRTKYCATTNRQDRLPIGALRRHQSPGGDHLIRIVAALAVALIGLVLLLIVAPFLLLGALLTLVLAWRRPATVERVSSHPRLAPVPNSVRSTPMRFAASLVAVTLALTATSAAIAGPPRESAAASPTPTEDASDPTSTPDPTAEPTAQPTRTPHPTPKPTASPEPTPKPEPTPALGEAPTGPTVTGVVVNVVDGDTIDVSVDGAEMRVRLIGMDTPEVHSGVEWLGPEASDAMSDLVAGHEVVLEKDVSETDQYGRALRYVWLESGSGWLLVNLELIRLGFASVTTYPPDVKYVDALYLDAQADAQAASLGRWGAAPTPVPTPVPPPPPTAAPPPPPTAAPATAAPPSNCEPSYPDICVPIGSADLNCPDMYAQGISMIRVRYDVANPDPHRFDGNDNDGWGCEG